MSSQNFKDTSSPTQLSQQPQAPQSQSQFMTQDKQEKHVQCIYHPCRSKYFCIEKDCTASKRSACGECYTEAPHQHHKIIQNEEYEQALKTNYQKVQQQCGTIETTFTLIQKVQEQFKKLKDKLNYSLDQAQQHIIREIQSKQDYYETETFKTLILRIKQLKSSFFYGGVSSFDKTIGDFSLKLYNLDEDVLNYITKLKTQRDTYFAPFLQQYQTVSDSIDKMINQDIGPIFQLSPQYPMIFEVDSFKGEPTSLSGHTNKFQEALKFIHNQNTQKSQQLDAKMQSLQNQQNFIFSCAQDNTIRLWNLGSDGDSTAEPKLWKTYMFNQKNITSLAQMSYSELATGSTDGTVSIWNVANSSCIMKFNHLDIQDEKTRSQSQLNSNEDLQSNAESQKQQSLNIVSTLTMINESVLAAGYSDGQIRIWDSQRGVVLKDYNFFKTKTQTQFQRQQRSIPNIEKINQWVLVSIGSNYKQQQNDNSHELNSSTHEGDSTSNNGDAGSPLQKQQNKNPVVNDTNQVELSQVVVWDWQTDEVKQIYEKHQHRILNLVRVSHTIVSSSLDNEIHVWEYENGSTIHIYKEHDSPAKALVALSDSMFASSGDDLILKIWDIEQEDSVQTYNSLAPQNEQEKQMQSQKPNSITFLGRISESSLISGSNQPPYIHIWK